MSKSDALPRNESPLAAAPSAEEEELVVGRGVRIVGSIHAPGNVRLMGCIEGDLVSRNVLVAATGEIRGTVRAERVEVCGRVAHSVVGTEAVIVRSTARVEGDVVYATLEIEPGAAIQGQLRIAADGADPDIASRADSGEPAPAGTAQQP